MFNLSELVRPNIEALQPYSSAREEFTGQATVYLDANENPFGDLNRYPDPYQTDLKRHIAKLKGIAPENIFLGNGSDEVIDLLFRIFCRPARDKVLCFTPTYGMYQVSANINDVEMICLPLSAQFNLTDQLVEDSLRKEDLKLIFLCSPNNPSGNTLSRKHIEQLLQKFKGLVIIDEAYADFSSEKSWRHKLDEYPNLVVLQTLSKAWGLAAARIGMAFCSTEIVTYFNKTKPPYNISRPNQQAALKVLGEMEIFEKRLARIKQEKAKMEKALQQIPSIRKVYPSEANFILVKTKNAPALYRQLIAEGIVVRNRHALVANCLRITVGTPRENETLLKALKK